MTIEELAKYREKSVPNAILWKYLSDCSSAVQYQMYCINAKAKKNNDIAGIYPQDDFSWCEFC